jgi:ATP-dependent DNA ligase
MTENSTEAARGLALLAEPLDKLAQNLETAKSVEAASTGHAAALEPKFDGWRLLAVVGEDGKCRTYTRTGNEMTGKLPAIEAALSENLPPGSVLDGEAVAFAMEDDRLVQKWGGAAKVLGAGTAKAALGSGAITFVAFDLLAHGGIDARALSYEKRRSLLVSLFAAADFGEAKIILVPQLAATEASHDTLIEAGYEGSVVKHLDAPYASGKRGKGWYRLKPQATVDVVVTGYKEGEGSFAGLVGAVHFGQYDADGILVERGRCSGMDWDTRKFISANREACLGRVFELAHHGAMPPTEAKPLGALRHPQFKRWRPDRTAESVEVHDG